MAVSRSVFFFYFPEFENIPSEYLTTVDGTLQHMEAQINRAFFPNVIIGDRVVMLKTAIHLALSPFGMPMRLKKESAVTVYNAELKKLVTAAGAAKGAF